ncbi:MAG: DUF6250 domain-containing protein [Tepidisphaeraceae bacterium]
MKFWQTFLIGGLTFLAAADRPTTTQASAGPLYSNDFTKGLADFQIEAEKPATVTAKDGVLDIDTPTGITVWLKQKLVGPVVIEYEVTAIKAGGANDRVSDVNCFWMADDPLHPGQLLEQHRTGKFADYDTITTYYVGYGGNTNTTTRFRRYIGEKNNRPIRKQDEYTDADHLLKPNVPMKIKLVADGGRIEYWRDGEKLFAYDDPKPYTEGHFGFRSVTSHLRIKDLKISRP